MSDELAESAIKDLLTRTEHVHLRIQRRNGAGRFANVTSVNKPTKELYTLDSYLRKLAGGGDFEIDVRDPNNQSERFFRLKLFLEGPAHPPRVHGSPAEQYMAGRGDGFVPPPSKFEEGLRPEQRKGYAMDRHRRYGGAAAPGATMASDEMAMQQIADLKAEKARLEAETRALTEKLDATHRESQRESATLREEMMKLRADISKKDQENKFELLQAELRSLREERSRPAVETKSIDYVGLAGALAPIATAIISSRAESGSTALQMQAQGMNNLMEATLKQADKESPMEKLTAQLIALGPIVAPFVQQFLSKNDPEKQAAIYDAMAANNLNSIAMMAQLVESFAAATAGEEDKWWVAVIKEALGGVVQATERYMQTPGGLPGQRPALPAAPSPYATVVDHAPAPTAASQPAGVETDRTVPNALRTLIPMLPAAYQTPEWVSGLEQLHAEPPLEIEAVATWWAGFVEKMIEDKTLPEEVANIMEQPRAALYGLVERLPAAKTRQQWLVDTVERLIAMLVEDGYLKQEVLDAEMAASQGQQPQQEQAVQQAVG